VAGRPHIEPLQGIGLIAGARFVEVFRGIGKLGRELRDQLGTNFIAARADRWTDCGQQVRRATGEFPLHGTDGFLRDAGESAAPSRVNCSDRALPWIDKKNRDAIGGLNGQQKTRERSGRGIADRSRIRGGVENLNGVRVNLLESDQGERFAADTILKCGAVFSYVFASVPIGKTQIQNILAIQRADSSFAGAETMNQPREFSEGHELQNAKTVLDFQCPGIGEGLGGFGGSSARLRGTFFERGLRRSHGLISIIATRQSRGEHGQRLEPRFALPDA
jgi:hypothetical protein